MQRWNSSSRSSRSRLSSRWGAGLPAAALVCALAVFGAGGCGESDRESAFREAAEYLDQARDAVTAAREEVDERTLAAEQTREELAEAQETLLRAEQELAKARARVGVHATDDVLFREVQTRLLDDDQLEGLAIAARVEKGIVTLSGQASSNEQRERAAELAAAIPGVLGVDNRIAIIPAQQGT